MTATHVEILRCSLLKREKCYYYYYYYSDDDSISKFLSIVLYTCVFLSISVLASNDFLFLSYLLTVYEFRPLEFFLLLLFTAGSRKSSAEFELLV